VAVLESLNYFALIAISKMPKFSHYTHRFVYRSAAQITASFSRNSVVFQLEHRFFIADNSNRNKMSAQTTYPHLELPRRRLILSAFFSAFGCYTRFM